MWAGSVALWRTNYFLFLKIMIAVLLAVEQKKNLKTYCVKLGNYEDL